MNIIRLADTVNGSPVLSGLKRVDDLASGLFLYGAGIQTECFISILNHADKQITMSKAAMVDGSRVPLEITNASVGVYHERVCAQADIKRMVDERGDLVKFNYRTEDDVDRDPYGSIEKRKTPAAPLLFRAFPVEFSPSQKKLEKAGIVEECDVLIYTAMQDWRNNGIGFADIEFATRNTVELQGESYEIKSKGLSSQFSDSFLYLTFGLVKR